MTFDFSGLKFMDLFCVSILCVVFIDMCFPDSCLFVVYTHTRQIIYNFFMLVY